MDKIQAKLIQLEQERESIERCQRNLREQMLILDNEEYSKKRDIYYKNKAELTEINRKMEILNNAMDILEGIGV